MSRSTFNNRVAVVTGASAGVGRAVAVALAEKGARVALLSRNRDRLEELSAQIRRMTGSDAVAVPADVADPEQVEAAGESVERELGPIDIWVNNAMVTVFSPFHQMTPEEFRRVTEVTYLGAVNGTRTALRRMLGRNSGYIVQIGSALGYQAIPLQSAYCGAKHALRGFTNALRAELIREDSGIHLCMVHLSAINTPQFDWARTRLENSPRPLPPVYQPEVAANGVILAIEKRRREVWVGFPSVKAIVGGKLFPALMEKLLARKAYEGQMSDEPLQRPPEGNLFESVEGDYDYGRFDEESRIHSLQLTLSRNRGLVAILAAAVVVVLLDLLI